MLLSVNFPLSEFQGASHRALSSAEVSRAGWWADRVLQPARDHLGPIRITSYVRANDTGAHRNGDGIDIVPLRVSVRALADWMAANMLGPAVQQVIYERDHVHLARVIPPGAVAGYLNEPQEGRYTFAQLDPAAISQSDYRIILAGAVGLGLLIIAAS